MRRVLFLDLDDTVFHSPRKRAPKLGDEAVAFASDGTPGSFMSPRQRAFFDWIVTGSEVVPTTGRSAAAYRRVLLPFSGWAICSFGGIILRGDGTSDPRWRERIANGATESRDVLYGLVDRSLVAGQSVSVRARVIEDDGLPLYVSVKTELDKGLEAVGEGLRGELPAGWRVHVNGRNLAVLPPFLGKENAVRWLIETVFGDDVLAIGAGDSASDAPFLAACDYALTPARSQLLTRLLASA